MRLVATAVLVALVAACTDLDVGATHDHWVASPGASPTTAEPTPGHDEEFVRVEGHWQLLDEATAPTSLSEVGGAVFEGRIWTVGGLRGDGSGASDVLAFDPATREWHQGPDLPQRSHHVALAGGDRLVAIGGYEGDFFAGGGPSAQVWVLSEDQTEWTPGPELPEPRGAGAATWDGSRIVFAGGVGPEGVASEVFALEGEQWRMIGQLGQPREHLAAASDGEGSVWFLAGRRLNGFMQNVSDVDVVVGDEVTPVGNLRSSTSGGPGFHLAPFGACVAGGETASDTINRVECIDGDGRVSVLPVLARARHGHAVGVIDGVVHVLLGGPNAGVTVSDTVQVLVLDR